MSIVYFKNILLKEEMKEKDKLLKRKAQLTRDTFINKTDLIFRLENKEFWLLWAEITYETMKEVHIRGK